MEKKKTINRGSRPRITEIKYIDDNGTIHIHSNVADMAEALGYSAGWVYKLIADGSAEVKRKAIPSKIRKIEI